MTERKTIYLDDALEAIRKLPNAGIHWFVSAEAVFDALLKLPSALTEVIRCKDCKHWDELLNMCGRTKRQALGVNGFCSRAERREE